MQAISRPLDGKAKDGTNFEAQARGTALSLPLQMPRERGFLMRAFIARTTRPQPGSQAPLGLGHDRLFGKDLLRS